VRRRINAPLSPNFNATLAGERTLPEWRKLNAERAIAAGETPFRYWFMQSHITLMALEKRSGVPRERLLDLDRGDARPTETEGQILAALFGIEASDLLV